MNSTIKIIRTSIFIFIIIGLSIPTISQPKHSYINDAVMPAPNAATLGRFTDIPVDYATGVPSISIPIYTMKYGSLTLPINLSYHAGGVKLGEPASWVGLNWNLAAGGMITRTVAGLPDDNAAGYYQNGINLASQLAGDCAVYCSVGAGAKDVEPDIFTVAYPGGSFKFYFDLQKKIVKINKDIDDSIRVFAVGAYVFGGFEVRVTNGVRYIFGQENSGTPNCRESTTFSTNNQPFISSWHLTKMITQDGAYTINFTYTDENYVMKSKASRQYTFSSVGTGSAGVSGAGSSADIPNLPYWINNIAGKRLTSITSGMETINFIANTVRQDLDATAYQLDIIEIYPTNASSTFCKRFYFTYDYFQDNNYSYSYAKRLQLKSIQEKSCNNLAVVPPYAFTYSGTLVGGKIFLPHRMSNQIDHWDYYNGKTANDALDVNVPNTTIPFGTGYISYGASDRNPDTIYSKQGVITNMTYPTGGSATYTYEGNQVAQNTITGTTTPVNISTCGTPGPSCCGAITVNNTPVSFTSSALSTVKFDLDAVRNPQGPPNNCAINTSVTASIWNGATQVGVSYAFNLAADQQSGGVYSIPIAAMATLVPEVSYIFRVTSTEGRGTLKVYYTTSSIQNVVGAGLRVKSIRLNDNLNNANDILHTYQYTQSGSSLSSNTVVISTPDYGSGYSNIAYFDPNLNYGSTATWSASSITPLSDFNGNTLLYSRVVDVIGGNGSSEMLYNTATPAPITLGLSSCTIGLNQINNSMTCSGGSCPEPLRPYSSLRGKIASINIYNQSGTILKSTTYSYTNSGTTSTGIMMKYQYFGCSVEPGQIGYTLVNILRTGYSLRSEKSLLTSIIETIDGVSATTTYEYDAAGRHSSPIATNITNSDGITHRTETKYTYDMPADAVRDSLLSRNILIPYETIKKVNNLQVDGNRTNYSLFNSIHPYPSSYQRYKMTWDINGTVQITGWQTDAIVDSIDIGTGYPSKFTTSGWSPEYYTWNTFNKKIATRRFNNFTWTYDYHQGTAMVSRITDLDGQYQDFTYDALSRLLQTNARYGNQINNYSYHYPSGAANDLAYVETAMNYTPAANSLLTQHKTRAYIDGLGRSVQNIQIAHSPALKDVVQVINYDAQGRPSHQYTPLEASTTDGSYYIGGVSSQPYSLSEYEASPLNRASAIKPPDWYRTKTIYGANTIADSVWMNGGSIAYPAGTLYKSTVIDSNSNRTITFTDILGRTVLSRRTDALGSAGKIASTYTIYDARSRVATIIPPDATLSIPNLLFKYVYDDEDKVVLKKVPDAAAVNTYYNSRDLPAIVSIPHLSKYQGTLYDSYGRVTKTGLLTSLPADYDSFMIIDSLSSMSYDGQRTDGSTITNVPIEKGKIATEKVRVLGTDIMLYTSHYYDRYGRDSLTRGTNSVCPATPSEIISYTYDHADHLTTSSRQHRDAACAQTVIDTRYTYDAQGRKKDYYINVASVGEKKLASYDYNYRDELITRHLGSTASGYLQDMEYAYNAQGWTTDINQLSSLAATKQLISCSALATDLRLILFHARDQDNVMRPGQKDVLDIGIVNDGDYPMQEPMRLKINKMKHIRFIIDTTPAGIYKQIYREQWKVKEYKDHYVFTSSGAESLYTSRVMDLAIRFVTDLSRQATETVRVELSDTMGTGETSIIDYNPTNNRASRVYTISMDHHAIPMEKHPSDITRAELNELIKNKPIINKAISPTLEERSTPSATNTDLFALHLDYDQTVPGLYNTSQYNGNIAAVHWKTAGYTERIYTYDYDFLDRLNVADYYDRDLSGTLNTDNKYMEKFTHNDLRGNMCAIARRGSLGSCLFGRTDDPHITIGTNTNLVTNVSESGSQTTGFIKGSGDLNYDVSGNNITNGAKGISYTRYNHLNLPDSIVIPTQGKISLRYDAHGRLLRKTIITNTGGVSYKSYNDGIEYRGGATDTLDAIYTNEGRITKNSGIFDYEYYLKDYLGNTRVVFDDKNGDQVISNNEILQLNDYYAYGMPHEGAFPGIASGTNQYKYNGKELTEDFGWNVYRYGARWYDSGIERWTSVDPMAEKRAWMSPYSYVQNNPVLRNDPTGALDEGPGDLFKSPSIAAKDFGNTYNDNSIREGQEYGSTIFQIVSENKTYYTYTEPARGGATSVRPSSAPKDNKVVADIHSHGCCLEGYRNNDFSKSDKRDNDKKGIVGYLTTPDGTLKKYDPKTQKVTTIRTDLPSDPNDPDRKNKKDPVESSTKDSNQKPVVKLKEI